MKRFLALGATGLILAACPLHANIGETQKQSEARYGRPLKVVKGEVFEEEDALMFEKGEFEIRVSFRAGKTEAIQYRKKLGTSMREAEPLSASELVGLLKENAGKGKWQKVRIDNPNVTWVNGALMAQYISDKKMLLIATKPYLEKALLQMEAERAVAGANFSSSEESKDLSGTSTISDWLKASPSQKMRYCKATADKLGRPGITASFISDALKAFCNSSKEENAKEANEAILKMSLSEVVAACILIGEAEGD